MALNGFLQVSPNGQTPPRETAAVINGTRQGKLNCLFAGSLATGLATTTTFTGTDTLGAEKIGPESMILAMPLDANAAAELAAGTMYVSAQNNETVTITHAASALARSFRFLVIG